MPCNDAHNRDAWDLADWWERHQEADREREAKVEQNKKGNKKQIRQLEREIEKLKKEA